jgi:hypothetical protein
MNYPLHLTHLAPPPGFAECDPVVLHYHDRVDDQGLISPCPYPIAQRRIDLLNARIQVDRTSQPIMDHDRRMRHSRAAGWVPRLIGRFRKLGRQKPRTSEFLITGIPRSGTSHLCHLLHRYDNCVVLNEPAEILTILEHQRIPHGLRAFLAATRRKIAAGEPIENKLTNGEVTSDTTLNDARTSYVPHPRNGAFALGVKNTASVLLRLESICEVMDGVRLIACIRNPFDTIASWIRSFPHLRDADVVRIPVGNVNDVYLSAADRSRLRQIAETTDVALRRALLWRHFAEIILRNRQRLHLVRYEELVVAPVATLGSIFSGQMPGRLTKAILPSAPRRTGSELDPHNREAISAICADIAAELELRAAA